MSEATATMIDATVAFAVGVYARLLAAGADDESARSIARSAADGFLDGYGEGFGEGHEIGRRTERARLKALHDGYAVHGTESQRAIMALELGIAPDIDPAPADDDGSPPRLQH